MENRTPHILFVEDDETLGFVTRDNLELNGFKVTHMTDGGMAMKLVMQSSFDLALLDVMLPEIDGFTIGKYIRQQNPEIPILFLTAKSLKDDRLTGFGLGADDYITKPFSIEELVFRINVFLRRAHVTNLAQPANSKTVGKFLFDYDNLLLSTNGLSKTLTQKEADLMRYLLQHKNQVCKRSDILEQIWGEDDYFMGRSLDVFISRLRKYLSADPILQIDNIHGVGFKLRISE